MLQYLYISGNHYPFPRAVRAYLACTVHEPYMNRAFPILEAKIKSIFDLPPRPFGSLLFPSLPTSSFLSLRAWLLAIFRYQLQSSQFASFRQASQIVYQPLPSFLCSIHTRLHFIKFTNSPDSSICCIGKLVPAPLR